MNNGANNEGLDLRNVARHGENSMAALSQHQRNLYAELERRYGGEDFDRDAVFQDLSDAMQILYMSNPAADNHGQPLPFLMEANCPRDARLTNPAHAAYRYVFHSPEFERDNPWIHPYAQYTARNSARQPIGAEISDQHLTLLAYLWRMLNDDSVELQEGFNLADMRETFIITLAGMARAHNYDGPRVNGREVDDGDLDRPTCGAGVAQRLLRGLIGTSMSEDPRNRVLNPSLVNARFWDTVIQPMVNSLTLEEITSLNEAIQKYFLYYFTEENLNNLQYDDTLEEDERLTADERQLLARFNNIPRGSVREFYIGCTEFWTSNRMQNLRVRGSESGIGVGYDSGSDFADAMGNAGLLFFGQQLNQVVPRRMEQLQAEAQQAIVEDVQQQEEVVVQPQPQPQREEQVVNNGGNLNDRLDGAAARLRARLEQQQQAEREVQPQQNDYQDALADLIRQQDEQAAREQAEREAQERQARDRAAQEQAAREQAAREQAEREAQERARADQEARDRELAERLRQEELAAIQQAQEQAAREQAQREAQERARQQQEAQERARQQQEAQERARQQQEAQERARQQQEAQERARQQREAQERARQQQEARDRALAERLRQQELAAQREAQERAQREAQARAQARAQREAQERARREAEERARREREARQAQQQNAPVVNAYQLQQQRAAAAQAEAQRRAAAQAAAAQANQLLMMNLMGPHGGGFGGMGM